MEKCVLDRTGQLFASEDVSQLEKHILKRSSSSAANDVLAGRMKRVILSGSRRSSIIAPATVTIGAPSPSKFRRRLGNDIAFFESMVRPKEFTIALNQGEFSQRYEVVILARKFTAPRCSGGHKRCPS